jgi:hypothetical protein
MIDLYRWWRGELKLAWRFEFADAAAQLERATRRKWWWGFTVTEALRELRQARDRLFENDDERLIRFFRELPWPGTSLRLREKRGM